MQRLRLFVGVMLTSLCCASASAQDSMDGLWTCTESGLTYTLNLVEQDCDNTLGLAYSSG